LVLLPVSPGPSSPLSEAVASRSDTSIAVPEVNFLPPAEAWLRSLLDDQRVLKGGGIRRANGAVFLAVKEGTAGPLSRRAELDGIIVETSLAQARVFELERRTNEAGAAHREAEQTLAAAETRAERARAGHR